jgi:hypothetical protein
MHTVLLRLFDDKKGFNLRSSLKIVVKKQADPQAARWPPAPQAPKRLILQIRFILHLLKNEEWNIQKLYP